MKTAVILSVKFTYTLIILFYFCLKLIIEPLFEKNNMLAAMAFATFIVYSSHLSKICRKQKLNQVVVLRNIVDPLTFHYMDVST